MPPRSSSDTVTSTPSTHDESTPTPEWDTSPLSLPSYLLTLRRWVPRQDSRFRRLIETYSVLDSKGIIHTMSDNHTDRLLNFVLPRGTVENPTIVAETDVETNETEQTRTVSRVVLSEESDDAIFRYRSQQHFSSI